MENINRLRERLAIMLCEENDRKKQKERKKRKMSRAALYTKDRMDGMTGVEIAKKYGVSHQAVYKACIEYRKKGGAEDGK